AVDRVAQGGPEELPTQERAGRLSHAHLPSSPSCSAMGPRARAGMKVRAPTRTMVPQSRMTKRGPWVGKVPGPAGTLGFCTSEPAMAGPGMTTPSRPAHITTARHSAYQGPVASSPANAEPLLFAPEEKAYRISLNPWAPGFVVPPRPHGNSTASAVAKST